MVRYPLPITSAMVTPANPHAGKPRYDSAPNVAADWHGGDFGQDVDIAEAMQAVANSHSAAVTTDYDPQHQEGKGKNMTPVLKPLPDLGKDYGTYAGSYYRSGPITPRTPYPDATSPPIVTGVSPNTGLAAGGTAITISGVAFTGATNVTIGGTAAGARVVVDANTITCTTPAKAAGTYDVLVTTPKGTSTAQSGAVDNFVYT
jgi:hypothetical protein